MKTYIARWRKVYEDEKRYKRMLILHVHVDVLHVNGLRIPLFPRLRLEPRKELRRGE